MNTRVLVRELHPNLCGIITRLDDDTLVVVVNPRLSPLDRLIVAGRLAEDMAGMTPAIGTGHDLTEGEKRVLANIARGCSNREIARSLGIAVSTVKSRAGAAFSKIGAGNRAEAAAWAARRLLGNGELAMPERWDMSPRREIAA